MKILHIMMSNLLMKIDINFFFLKLCDYFNIAFYIKGERNLVKEI